MRETWYVLENGEAADPREVAPDVAGVLRHVSGIAVAMRGQAASSRGVDPEEERAKARALNADKAKPKGKGMNPAEAKAGYVTRESKAR
jgi:hypothetical protein